MDFHQFDVDWRSLRRRCSSLACRKGCGRVRNKTQFRPWISIWTCIYIYTWGMILISSFFDLLFFITLWKLHRVFRNFLTFSCLARLRFKGFFRQMRMWELQELVEPIDGKPREVCCQDVPNKNQGQIQDLREVGCGLGDLGFFCEVCGDLSPSNDMKWIELTRKWKETLGNDIFPSEGVLKFAWCMYSEYIGTGGYPFKRRVALLGFFSFSQPPNVVWGALAKEQAKQTDYDFIKSGHSVKQLMGVIHWTTGRSHWMSNNP